MWRPESRWPVATAHSEYVPKCAGNECYPHSRAHIWATFRRQGSSSSYGQHFGHGLYKPNGGPQLPTYGLGQGHLAGSRKVPPVTNCGLPSWVVKCRSRFSKSATHTIRMGTQPRSIQLHRRPVGTPHHRPLRQYGQPLVTQVQQSILGSSQLRNRRTRSDGLGDREQLCEPSIPVIGQSSRESDGNEGIRNHNRSGMAGATVVPETESFANLPSASHSKLSAINAQANRGVHRTIEKSAVANICLESVWREKLSFLGWSYRAVRQYPLFLAKETLGGYNRLINRFQGFCIGKGEQLPQCAGQDILVEFLCEIADGSERPNSQLKCALAAMSHLYDAYDLPNLTHSAGVRNMVTALVKSGTVRCRQRSHVLPIGNFVELFCAWPNNKELDLKRLRLKTLVLLSLALMLRPSDVAPKGLLFDPDNCAVEPILFRTSDVRFNPDGSATIWIHGSKNDTDRAGFELLLPKCDNHMIDPVGTLASYIEQTAKYRTHNNQAVFLSLRPPFQGITHSTVTSVLSEAIKLAGLDVDGYKAKDFRPTGATMQIENGFDPEVVMKMGRWKTRSVFFEHYVHAKTPAEFTTKLLVQ